MRQEEREELDKIVNSSTVRKARDYAAYYNKGQTRKGGLDFMTHPEAVEGYLHNYGIESHVASSVAWLHDVLEDTDGEREEIEKVFGREISDGVWALTNKTKTTPSDWENYMEKILSASYVIKMVKLCDLLHNVSTLHLISQESVKKKFRECEEFYLPLAKLICPKIGMDIQSRLIEYLRNGGGKNGKD